MILHLRPRLGGGPRGFTPSGRGRGPPPRAGALVRSFTSLAGGLLTYTGRCRSLCLYGRTKTGKTDWARSLGSHIYCIGLVSGSECMKAADVEYAIFDDLRGGIKFFPAYKEWLGCQSHVTVKCLYKEPKLVKWGKPSIWLANTDPREK